MSDLDHKKAKARILWLLADPREVRAHIERESVRMKLIQEAHLGDGRSTTLSLKLNDLTDAQSMELRAACWRAAGIRQPEADTPSWWREDLSRRVAAGQSERDGSAMDARIAAALERLGLEKHWDLR